MKTHRAIAAATTLAGSLSGAAIGAWTANVIQARRYNDPEWDNLDPAYFALFAGLFALASLELGRWIAAVHAGTKHPPLGWGWLVALLEALARLATAGIGLRLGFEAGHWTAWIWYRWGSTAQYSADALRELKWVWIASACLWGGALAILGFRLSRSLPPFTAFLGAFLGLRAVPYALPSVIGLYWGPFPNSDVHSFVLAAAQFLTTGVLVVTFAIAGYWLGRLLERQWPVVKRS